MKHNMLRWIVAILTLELTAAAYAGTPVLIRDATVHTMTSAGTLEHTDILISDGKIDELARNIKAPADAEVIDAKGRPVTPGLFGGISHLGLEEIGEESSIDDYSLTLGMRPEFDVTLAFNPSSTVLGVSRLGGITFSMVAPSSSEHGHGVDSGSLIAGQGAMARLDGSIDPATHALFVELGGGVSGLSGGSRAAQFMLLQQAITEVRSTRSLLPGDARLLTVGGRQALGTYLEGSHAVVFAVDRTADIRQVIAFAKREKLHAIITGGAEAWRVAPELAAAKIPVLLNPLTNLPDSFDSVGSTLENAARLQRAGVKFAFTFTDDPSSYNIRKIRQTAGIAVAHGLPWDEGLAAITSHPAEIFGVASTNGSLAKGRPADLVLWSGDPLEVTTLADRVFIQGVSQSMQSRQTELRDRYLQKLRANAAR
jgi:imidazolonepropionase-like amidohydrolase